MSEQKAAEFLSKLTTDASFASKLSTVEPSREGWVKLANATGYSCTMDEMNRVDAAIRSNPAFGRSTQLSDHDLEHVSGGALAPSLSAFKYSNFSYSFNFASFKDLQAPFW